MKNQSRFIRYVLRTTDVDAARDFYARVLGPRDLAIFELHESARARGAPSHWLGHIGVRDVSLASREIVARGGTALGMANDVAVMRDPGGAVIAFAPRDASPTNPGVAWHDLNTPDVARSADTYASIGDWTIGEPRAMRSIVELRELRYADGEPPAGAIVSTAGRPNVHPHWLFHFGVDSLDASVDAARSAGALVIGPVLMPGGTRVAVCDDPQGAAFALREVVR